MNHLRRLNAFNVAVIVNILQSSGFLEWLLLVLTPIVMQTCALDNSSSIENAPFLNTTRTCSFQTQNAKGSCRPISKVETGFVSEKSYFSFAVRENWESR